MKAAAVGLTIVIALAVQGASASGRTVLQSIAPAPTPAAAVRGPVDGVFVLPAAQAAFVNSTTLVLTGVSNTTAWVQFTPAPKAGTITQEDLVSPSLAASTGTFLGSPQASLSGSYNGNQSTVLLEVDAPRLDESTYALYIDYKVLPVNETGLVAVGGTVNTLVAQHNGPEGGAGDPILPYVTPGSTTFYNATLTIDVVSIQTYVAQQGGQKAGLIRVPLGGCCYGWGWWG